jgi:hypothetical protein
MTGIQNRCWMTRCNKTPVAVILYHNGKEIKVCRDHVKNGIKLPKE